MKTTAALVGLILLSPFPVAQNQVLAQIQVAPSSSATTTTVTAPDNNLESAPSATSTTTKTENTETTVTNVKREDGSATTVITQQPPSTYQPMGRGPYQPMGRPPER